MMDATTNEHATVVHVASSDHEYNLDFITAGNTLHVGSTSDIEYGVSTLHVGRTSDIEYGMNTLHGGSTSDIEYGINTLNRNAEYGGPKNNSKVNSMNIDCVVPYTAPTFTSRAPKVGEPAAANGRKGKRIAVVGGCGPGFDSVVSYNPSPTHAPGPPGGAMSTSTNRTNMYTPWQPDLECGVPHATHAIGTSKVGTSTHGTHAGKKASKVGTSTRGTHAGKKASKVGTSTSGTHADKKLPTGTKTWQPGRPLLSSSGKGAWCKCRSLWLDLGLATILIIGLAVTGYFIYTKVNWMNLLVFGAALLPSHKG